MQFMWRESRREKNRGDSVKYSQNRVKANVYNIRYS